MESVDMVLILAENLEKQGYLVEVYNTKEEATEALSAALTGKTIGIGGSQTVAQMGLFPALASHNTVYWHDAKPENMTISETRLAAARSPIYISSVNGISVQGDIVNIDATGNRVAAISYGPEHIYLLVGENKIADSYEAAMERARNIAAPLNARRLGRKTPCAIHADHCYDCQSPDRICRNFVVFHKCPYGAKYHVILIRESLGY